MIFDEKKNLDFYRNLGIEADMPRPWISLRIRTLRHWSRESMRLTARTYMPT